MVNPPYYEEDWGWLRTPRIGYVPVILFYFLVGILEADIFGYA
jgi:hypothetical protein